MTTSKARKQDRAITFLTQEEVQRLFSAIKTKRDRAIFAVAYRHGLRASEVGMLQLTDLDLKAGRITINRVKGSMSGTYPMAPDNSETSPLLHQEPEGCFPLPVYIQSRTADRPAYPVVDDEEVQHRRRHTQREATIPRPQTFYRHPRRPGQKDVFQQPGCIEPCEPLSTETRESSPFLDFDYCTEFPYQRVNRNWG